jgi:hypothetical protein
MFVSMALLLCLTAAVLPAPGDTAMAAVSAAEAERLGGPELTPVGAERAGNAEGTIPAWTGGIQQAVDAYRPGNRHPDPFAEDTPLFTITADNQHLYADHLSEGQQALLEKYPESWRMPIYPSRRSAAYPDHVYAAFKRNATSAGLVLENRGGVTGAAVTSPFPIPNEGAEIVWNHNMRWRGLHITMTDGQAPVTRSGRYTLVVVDQEMAFPYSREAPPEAVEGFPSLLLSFKQRVRAPSLLAGQGRLVLESYNYNLQQRQTWLYSPNLRRILRTPFNGFDNPAPNADGLRFSDEVDLFNGSPALFNWKILGKREMYIPYNAYRIHSDALSYEDILEKRHIAPEHVRYELHRVWVVEGTVKVERRDPRARRLEDRGHLYARRVLYVDEDSWQVAMTDNYDAQGRLWRYAEGHMINFYEVPVPWYTLQVYYDFQARRYLVTGLDNRRRPAAFTEAINPRLFGPNALDFYLR